MPYSPGIQYRGDQLIFAGNEGAANAIGRGLNSGMGAIQEGLDKNRMTKEELDFLNGTFTSLDKQGVMTLEEKQKYDTGSIGTKRAIVSAAGAKLNQIYKEDLQRREFDNQMTLEALRNGGRQKPVFDVGSMMEVPLPGGQGKIVMDANGTVLDPSSVMKPEKPDKKEFDFGTMEVVNAGDLGRVIRDGGGNILDPSKLIKPDKNGSNFDFTTSETKDVPGVGRVLVDGKGNLLDPSKVFKPDEKKGPTEAEVAFNTNVKVALDGLDELDKVVKDEGNWASGLANPTNAAKLQAKTYQLAIQYAKIVDPSSVAREGEVAAAQKYMIPMGLTTRNSVTRASIKNMKDTIYSYANARADAEGKQKPYPDFKKSESGVPKIGTKDEYEKLKSGSQFMWSDGRIGVKP